MLLKDEALLSVNTKKLNTWQIGRKQLKWIDEATKEPLCDEAVIFDNKVCILTSARKVKCYPEIKDGLIMSVLRTNSKRNFFFHGENLKKVVDDSVDVAFLFDEGFQARADKYTASKPAIRKVKS